MDLRWSKCYLRDCVINAVLCGRRGVLNKRLNSVVHSRDAGSYHRLGGVSRLGYQ